MYFPDQICHNSHRQNLSVFLLEESFLQFYFVLLEGLKLVLQKTFCFLVFLFSSE